MVGMGRLRAIVLEGAPRSDADLAVKRNVIRRGRHGAKNMMDFVTHAFAIRTARSLLDLEGHDGMRGYVGIPSEVDRGARSFVPRSAVCCCHFLLVLGQPVRLLARNGEAVQVQQGVKLP